jgi:hypothetical protein
VLGEVLGDLYALFRQEADGPGESGGFIAGL